MSDNSNYKPTLEERVLVWIMVSAFKITIIMVAIILPISFVSQLFQNSKPMSPELEEKKKQINLQNMYK